MVGPVGCSTLLRPVAGKGWPGKGREVGRWSATNMTNMIDMVMYLATLPGGFGAGHAGWVPADEGLNRDRAGVNRDIARKVRDALLPTF